MFNIEINKAYLAAKAEKWNRSPEYFTLRIQEEKHNRYMVELTPFSNNDPETKVVWIHKSQLTPNFPGLRINTRVESITFGNEAPAQIQTEAPTMYVVFDAEDNSIPVLPPSIPTPEPVMEDTPEPLLDDHSQTNDEVPAYEAQNANEVASPSKG